MVSPSPISILFGVSLLLSSPLVVGAAAQTGATSLRAVDFQKDGVKFTIMASVRADPAAPYGERDDDRGVASLAVNLRISAHATEAEYFGTVSETFSNFWLKQGSGDKFFWQDGRCHQRRGLPKTTVTAIDGSIGGDNAKNIVNARLRHLGKLLPADEISTGTKLPDGVDQNGRFIAYRSQTKLSRLWVDVKIYVADCELVPGTPPARPLIRQPH